MKSENSINIAILDTSVIIRSGMAHVIKHVPDNDISVVEISSAESLANYLSLHTPDIMIVNPLFGGWFDVAGYKASYPETKFVALLSTAIDMNMVREYDISISVFDEMDDIVGKLVSLTGDDKSGQNAGQEILSQREKEIIVCVVKGMTNKEIADKLFISIHTVVTHRRNIAKKLQIHSPAGLTIYAIVNKLVNIDEVRAF